MRPPSPRSLLVEHPALPQPFEREESGARKVAMASLDRTERVRVAVQLVSVAALLADFELWPGRSALRRTALEVTDRGLRVRLPALPVPISRIWSRLGGGDPAAEGTRTAVLATIAELTDLESAAFEPGGTEPGFFLDGVLARLLGELDRPLDESTARSLWMWRWSLPPMPEIGDTSLLAVPDERVAMRVGAAMWAAAVRRGEGATLEVARLGNGPTIVAGNGRARAVRVIAGSFDDRVLTSIIDCRDDRESATIALGRFPNGWNPVPAPVLDPERIAVHLKVTGLSPARRLRFVDGQAGRFDIFSPADRRSLTRSAAMLYSEPRNRNVGRFRELVGVAGLAPEGVPVARALEVSGAGEDHLDAACDSQVVIRRQDLGTQNWWISLTGAIPADFSTRHWPPATPGISWRGPEVGWTISTHGRSGGCWRGWPWVRSGPGSRRRWSKPASVCQTFTGRAEHLWDWAKKLRDRGRAGCASSIGLPSSRSSVRVPSIFTTHHEPARRSRW